MRKKSAMKTFTYLTSYFNYFSEKSSYKYNKIFEEKPEHQQKYATDCINEKKDNVAKKLYWTKKCLFKNATSRIHK